MGWLEPGAQIPSTASRDAVTDYSGEREPQTVDEEPMSDVEAVTTVAKEEFMNMANRSSEEIKALPAQVQFLAPKAQAYDCIAIILGALVQQQHPSGEELAKLLDARVEFLARPNDPQTP